MAAEAEENRRLHRLAIVAGVVLVVVLWIIFGFGPMWFWSDHQQRASFGDMFGAVSALFSGLAFAILIYAILLQKEELGLQRKELEQTRAELAGQREQLTLQNETLRKQTFENTFFQMLRLHNEIVRSMEVWRPGIETQGRDCFRTLYKALHKTISEGTSEGRDKGPEERLNYAYLKFFREHESEVGHYFRNLYQIVKFVKNSNVAERRFYTNIVRAQLSAHELALLFYNCLSDLGRGKFKPLVEEFGLLKTLNAVLLLEPSHRELYREAAYQGSSAA